MKNINRIVSLGLLFPLFLKLMVKGLQVHESIVLLGLICLYCIFEHQASQKQVEDINNSIKILNERLDAHAKEVEAAKTYVTSIKLGNQMRPRAG